MNIIIDAARFAEFAHRGVLRKFTGTPYIWHPMRVAGRTCLYSDDPTLIAAAWLHDVVEDNPTIKISGIRQTFGECVATFVSELTNPSKTHPELSRRDRKKMDRDHLRNVSPGAKLVKLIDRIDNVREMLGAAPAFLKLYKEESLLLRDIALAGTNPELEAELGMLARAE